MLLQPLFSGGSLCFPMAAGLVAAHGVQVQTEYEEFADRFEKTSRAGGKLEVTRPTVHFLSRAGELERLGGFIGD
jgi:hypothetical protein